MAPCNVLVFLLALLEVFSQLRLATAQPQGNSTWALLLNNAGIAAMHVAVTNTGTVIFLDRTDIGPSQLNLSNGQCRDDPNDQTLTHDCTAHSVMFNPATSTVRPLTVQTDTWCSSGQFLPNGTLLQTGGDNDGNKKIRYFTPCPADGTCDWVESTTDSLLAGRWYASNQLLPDGRVIVVGGRDSTAYEFVPNRGLGLFTLQLLVSTGYYNYYPFIHLLPNGHLYIFANRDSVLLDYNSNTVLQTYPTIPGEPRNYPCAGSSVMLALEGTYTDADVLVCGGANIMAPGNVTAQYPASQTCGRMTVTSASPSWNMQQMPIVRAMGDMVMLPNSQILIINGAQNGAQGWNGASNAALNPVLYDPDSATFEVLPASPIPRVYHSIATLLQDGRVLVAGSNCHQFYTFTGEFPTELRVEAFQPSYLDPINNPQRPVFVTSSLTVNYNTPFNVSITVPTAVTGNIQLTLTSAPFTTHSYSQGQRQVKLPVAAPVATGNNAYTVSALGPANSNLAPSCWYMLFAINNGISGPAIWVLVE